MKARASAVLFALISAKRLATRSSASSQPASRKLLPSRISGVVSRSLLLTKSQANLPLMQVETPLAGPSAGSTFRMWRALVQILKLQPTPPYVHTGLGRRIRVLRLAASASETLRVAV